MLNYFFVKTLLQSFAVFLTAGAGCLVAMKNGDMNLGGEAQIYAGGFLCTLYLKLLSFLPPVLSVIFSLVLSGITVSLITIISAFLQNKKGISFLLSSFIISSALIPFIDYLITGLFRTTTGPLLATAFIPKNCRYSFYINVIFSLFLAVILHLILKKTEWGTAVTMYGKAKEFALYSGVNQNLVTYSSSFLSGFLHGLSGAMSICGVYFCCHKGFYFGMGWNALAAAMIGKSNPLLLIPSSLFMAVLITSANQFALFSNFNFDISTLIQSVIIFIVAFPVIKTIHFKKEASK